MIIANNGGFLLYTIEIDIVYLYLESDKEADDGNDELLVIS